MASLFVLLEMEIGSLRRKRIFRDRLNPLDAYSDVEFITRYRIRREMFLELHDKLRLSCLDLQADLIHFR